MNVDSSLWKFIVDLQIQNPLDLNGKIIDLFHSFNLKMHDAQLRGDTWKNLVQRLRFNACIHMIRFIIVLERIIHDIVGHLDESEVRLSPSLVKDLVARHAVKLLLSFLECDLNAFSACTDKDITQFAVQHFDPASIISATIPTPLRIDAKYDPNGRSTFLSKATSYHCGIHLDQLLMSIATSESDKLDIYSPELFVAIVSHVYKFHVSCHFCSEIHESIDDYYHTIEPNPSVGYHKFLKHVNKGLKPRRTDGKRKSVHLSETSKRSLSNWMAVNWQNPYPSTEEKRALCMESGLSTRQINNWFINARVRKWRPSLEKARIAAEGGYEDDVDVENFTKKRRNDENDCET